MYHQRQDTAPHASVPLGLRGLPDTERLTLVEGEFKDDFAQDLVRFGEALGLEQQYAEKRTDSLTITREQWDRACRDGVLVPLEADD